ncbi:putative mitochondrial phosphate carrier protein [Dioszegia hungarica]|uniref:Mitochondrial phosphate carrier protein n=1 Tax=Dioszegia hungarica TaxID=4972 RepID=A0AA38LUF1_9TREE|nr:putative mitochondrial phosphate carrier protein [Dioszegia hungarica]KAI9634844.1 putative mitochondrial phosphate carrier protein [Dioszegia hungarica]
MRARPNPFFATTQTFFAPSIGDRVDQAIDQDRVSAHDAKVKGDHLRHHIAELRAEEVFNRDRIFALGAVAREDHLQHELAAVRADHIRADTHTAVGVPPTGIDLYSRFAVAGALGCAITHGVLTPVDVIKTRIQLEPEVYNRGMVTAFRQVVAAEGAGALLTGLGPTIVGYSIQGALKFGGYEYWKKQAVNILGLETAREYRTAIYLVTGGIAEFFADIALCPLEATRIRLVSQPSYANGLVGGFGRILREEGPAAFYAGFGPILFKQVPYTMVKFGVFELASERILQTMGQTKESLSSGTATAVNLGSGLIGGMAAAVVSQPADTLLSKINKAKGAPGQSTTSRLVSMASQLGVRGLFTGMSARLVMIGTLSAGQFMIYGDIKKALNATGGVEISK